MQNTNNQRSISFANGVLVLPTNNTSESDPENATPKEPRFFTHEQAPSNTETINRIPLDFDPAWLAKDSDPETIPTPVLDQILRDQGWGTLPEWLFCAMHFGRPLFPVGEWDSWPVIPFDLAPASGAASSVLQTVSEMFDPRSVITATTDEQTRNALFRITPQHHLVLFPDVRKRLDVGDEGLLRAAIAGEELCRRAPGRAPQCTPWTTPLLMAGETIPTNQGEGFRRRVYVFPFRHRAAETVDSSLGAELPALIAKGVRHYLRFAAVFGRSDDWMKLPLFIPLSLHAKKRH